MNPHHFTGKNQNATTALTSANPTSSTHFTHSIEPGTSGWSSSAMCGTPVAGKLAASVNRDEATLGVVSARATPREGEAGGSDPLDWLLSVAAVITRSRNSG